MKDLESLDAQKLIANTSAWSPAAWGTVYGAISAVSYTAANVCLRAVTGYDPLWVSCVKAFPTVVATALWLFFYRRPGERQFPPGRVIGTLVAAALLGQLGGNVSFQWALGVIGMALTVPLCMGALIIGSALLSRFYLNEPLTVRTVGALTALVAAIWVLSLGARGAADIELLTARERSWMVTLAVAGACLAGVSYAVLGVVIRRAVLRQASVAATTFCVAVTGLLSLGPACIARIGLVELIHTPAPAFAMMMMAGIFNLAAFVTLTRALQIATLVYVNALNATQVAMASVAGVLFFREEPSSALALGVGLTIVGLAFMPRQRKNAIKRAES